MIKILILLMSLAPAAFAQMRYSPTLTLLENEAARDPFASKSLESARKESSKGFTGEKSQQSSTIDGGGKTYVMEGVSPFAGINIYKPKLDLSGDGRTEKPETKPLIDPKLTKRALGLGGAALAGAGVGLAVGASAWIFAPLLLAAGALLGAGAVLWFIGRKTKPKS